MVTKDTSLLHSSVREHIRYVAARHANEAMADPAAEAGSLRSIVIAELEDAKRPLPVSMRMWVNARQTPACSTASVIAIAPE